MPDLNSSNSLPAEALSPELVTHPRRGRLVRLPLRTETGTIVYVDLLPTEAEVLGRRLGSLGYSAKANNEAAEAARTDWPGSDARAAKLVEIIRVKRGVWYPGRLVTVAKSAGLRLTMDESHLMLWEMTKHGVVRSLENSRFEVV